MADAGHLRDRRARSGRGHALDILGQQRSTCQTSSAESHSTAWEEPKWEIPDEIGIIHSRLNDRAPQDPGKPAIRSFGVSTRTVTETVTELLTTDKPRM